MSKSYGRQDITEDMHEDIYGEAEEIGREVEHVDVLLRLSASYRLEQGPPADAVDRVTATLRAEANRANRSNRSRDRSVPLWCLAIVGATAFGAAAATFWRGAALPYRDTADWTARTLVRPSGPGAGPRYRMRGPSIVLPMSASSSKTQAVSRLGSLNVTSRVESGVTWRNEGQKLMSGAVVDAAPSHETHLIFTCGYCHARVTVVARRSMISGPPEASWRFCPICGHRITSFVNAPAAASGTTDRAPTKSLVVPALSIERIHEKKTSREAVRNTP